MKAQHDVCANQAVRRTERWLILVLQHVQPSNVLSLDWYFYWFIQESYLYLDHTGSTVHEQT